MNQQVTTAGVVKGKWSYMSPEQVTSQPVDARSDVFSLGVILYELCSARRLFKGDSLPATVNLVAQASVPPLRDYVPNMPPRLERIILKALAKSPADRQQSAGELASELESYRASQPWTSGGRHLGTLVSTLFPKDGSTPGSTFMAGTDSTNPGVAVNSVGGTTLEPNEGTVALHIEVDEPSGLSPAVMWGAGVLALLASALFWYFLL
jgi:serine/threonine-protein kinase